jgi:hypothetical protein
MIPPSPTAHPSVGDIMKTDLSDGQLVAEQLMGELNVFHAPPK